MEHKKIDAARSTYDEANAALERMPLDEAGRRMLADIKQQHGHPAVERAIPLDEPRQPAGSGRFLLQQA